MLVMRSARSDTAATQGVYSGLQIAALSILWVFFSAAAAFRWLGSGRDYLEYLSYYDTIPYTFSFLDTRFEPGFHVLAWVFRVALNTEYGLFSLALIGFALGAKFYLMLRYLKYPVLAAVTYLVMIYPLHEYTQLRAAFAISLGLIAVHIWLEGRRVLATIGMAIAFLFHSSIVILFAGFLVAEFFRFNKQGILLIVVTVVAAVIATIADLSIVSLFSRYNPLISSYIENVQFEQEASFLSIGNLLYMTMIAAAMYAGWTNERYRRPFLIMSALSVFALAIFSESPTVAQRTKEVLFGTIIFAAYRAPITGRDMPAIGLLWVNAGALGWLSIQNGLIR